MLYLEANNKSTLGSILGPVLFNIFISDLKEVTRVPARKACKLHQAGRPVNMLKGRAAIQRDLDRLDERADKNLRKSDRRRKQNPVPRKKEAPAALSGRTNSVGSSSAEKDLRILLDSKLNKSQDCDLATKAANSILGCINMNIASK